MNIHDVYRPFLKYFRTKRMKALWQFFQINTSTRVLDVGGDPFNWSLLPQQPLLTYINLYSRRENGWFIGDARALPFRNNAFDIVYSNSVIEHLGDFGSQRGFADECRRVGRRYYVQTPNRSFPIELHLLTPLIHYLPRAVQRRLLRNFTVWGLITRPTDQQCESFLDEVRLLDEKEMREIFPDADMWEERVLGFTKSLIAVKR
jgi:hypothetical protein